MFFSYFILSVSKNYPPAQTSTFALFKNKWIVFSPRILSRKNPQSSMPTANIYKENNNGMNRQSCALQHFLFIVKNQSYLLEPIHH